MLREMIVLNEWHLVRLSYPEYEIGCRVVVEPAEKPDPDLIQVLFEGCRRWAKEAMGNNDCTVFVNRTPYAITVTCKSPDRAALVQSLSSLSQLLQLEAAHQADKQAVLGMPALALAGGSSRSRPSW